MKFVSEFLPQEREALRRHDGLTAEAQTSTTCRSSRGSSRPSTREVSEAVSRWCPGFTLHDHEGRLAGRARARRTLGSLATASAQPAPLKHMPTTPTLGHAAPLMSPLAASWRRKGRPTGEVCPTAQDRELPPDAHGGHGGHVVETALQEAASKWIPAGHTERDRAKPRYSPS